MIETAALAIAATYYATIVLTQARLTDFLRPQKDGQLRWYFTSCPLCMSVWVGAVVTAGLWRWPQVAPWVLAPLALAGAVTLILSVMSMRQPTPAPGVTPEQLAKALRDVEYHLRRIMLYMDTFITKNERRLNKLTTQDEEEVAAKAHAAMGGYTPTRPSGAPPAVATNGRGH